MHLNHMLHYMKRRKKEDKKKGKDIHFLVLHTCHAIDFLSFILYFLMKETYFKNRVVLENISQQFT